MGRLAWRMGPERLLRAETRKRICILSKAYQAKRQSAQRLREGKDRVSLVQLEQIGKWPEMFSFNTRDRKHISCLQGV